MSRNRAIAVWALVVVATLLLLVSSLTIWVKRQALDTDAWTNTSGQLLANDEIRGQLSIYLVDTLFNNTDANARIEQALPSDRAALAPVIAGALRNFAVQAAERLLATPQAQKLWEEANRRAHENLLKVPERRKGSQFPDGRGIGRARPEPRRRAAEGPPGAERGAARSGCGQDHDPQLGSAGHGADLA